MLLSWWMKKENEAAGVQATEGSRAHAGWEGWGERQWVIRKWEERVDFVGGGGSWEENSSYERMLRERYSLPQTVELGGGGGADRTRERESCVASSCLLACLLLLLLVLYVSPGGYVRCSMVGVRNCEISIKFASKTRNVRGSVGVVGGSRYSRRCWPGGCGTSLRVNAFISLTRFIPSSLCETVASHDFPSLSLFLT